MRPSVARLPSLLPLACFPQLSAFRTLDTGPQGTKSTASGSRQTQVSFIPSPELGSNNLRQASFAGLAVMACPLESGVTYTVEDGCNFLKSWVHRTYEVCQADSQAEEAQTAFPWGLGTQAGGKRWPAFPAGQKLLAWQLLGRGKRGDLV